MGKSSSPPPPSAQTIISETPDYAAAAEAQAASSREIAAATTTANRPDLYTPWGSQTWSSSPSVDASTGIPVTRWNSTISLSPQQQAALDSQMAVTTGRSQAAQGMLNRATNALAGDMSYDGLPLRSATVGAPSTASVDLNPDFNSWRSKGQQAALDFQAPIQRERREALESQLANMGFDRGSEAWGREMRTLSDQDARDSLQAFSAGQAETALNRDTAIALGDANMRSDVTAGNFNLDALIRAGSFNNANRQQAIAEGILQRQIPLNEVNALLTGQQVQSPQMPSFSTATQAQPTQYLSAATAQGNQALGNYNAQLGQYNAQLGQINASNAASANTFGGLTSLAGLFL